MIAGYVRALGWAARGQVAGDAQVDTEQLGQRAGVVLATGGVLVMPFSKRGFRLGVVTTDYPLEVDQPTALILRDEIGARAQARRYLHAGTCRRPGRKAKEGAGAVRCQTPGSATACAIQSSAGGSTWISWTASPWRR